MVEARILSFTSPISGLCLHFEIFAREWFSRIAEAEGRILVDAPVESGTAREKLDGKIRWVIAVSWLGSIEHGGR